MDFKFGFTWLFDKLGYIPKIKVDAGVTEAWPFLVVSNDFDPRAETKPVAKKKPVARKATTVAKKARKPKAK